MNIRTRCHKCGTAYQISINPVELHLVIKLSDGKVPPYAPCPRKCGGKILLSDTGLLPAQVRDVVVVTATELYQAVMGAGLPKERRVCKADLEKLLLRRKIVALDVEEHSDASLYLHEIHLEGGAVVHLTSGAAGALVLKVTETPKKRTKRKRPAN
jgi:hypothetical protein